MADAVYITVRACGTGLSPRGGCIGIRARPRAFEKGAARQCRQVVVFGQKEDEQVCEELRRGIDFHRIAKTHNRPIGSFIAPLVTLGKIGPNPLLDLFDPQVA
jgi:hypothetical protein